MDSDISDQYSDSDNEVDVKQHARLVENVLNLNKKQHVKKPTRTEPTLEISEFNLVKSVTGKKGTVHLSDLTKVLKRRGNLVDLGQKVKKSESTRTLCTPLEKPQAERIRRQVSYEKTRLELDKWEAVVTSQRAASHISFPLNTDLNLAQNPLESVSFRLKSDLQKNLEKFEPKVEVYNIEEEEKIPLTMMEIIEKRKEAAKMRAHMSFKEAKARRQSKIKSKKYHRILRREKIKQQLQEFELLQKTNPEAAMQKLEEIEKARAEERVTLRHKSTGQWAKNKQVRAKYDKESRKVLAQQLAISKELTQKVKPVEDSDSEIEGSAPATGTASANNPWVNDDKTENEIDAFISGYRKFWDGKNHPNDPSKEVTSHENAQDEATTIEVAVEQKPDKIKSPTVPGNSLKSNTKSSKIKRSKKIASQGTSDWEVSFANGENADQHIENVFSNLEFKLKKKLQDKYGRLKKTLKSVNSKGGARQKKKAKYEADLSIPVKATRPVIDEELISGDIDETTNGDLTSLKNILDSSSSPKKPSSNIDPNTFIKAKPVQLNTEIPDSLAGADDEDIDQKEAIAGAFEDEDIVADFQKEKQEDVDKEKPKDVDLTLPGWGSWGGKNVAVPLRKRKRFIIKMPKPALRRDENKGNVIVFEGGNKAIKEHLVSDVPFPFKTLKDYEASIRAPIGSTFVPETAFRKMTLPAVTTQMGAIITPMTHDVLLKKRKKK